MLYNDKGTMANAYDVAKNSEHEVGPPFAFADAMSWLESNGCLLGEASGGGGVEEVQATERSEEERAEMGDAMPPASRSLGEKLSRTMGSKQAKRRKSNDVNSFEMAAAVASIAESQKKRLEESRRRKNVSLMQSEDVPDSVRKAFFSRMAADLMGSLDAGPALDNNLSLSAEVGVAVPKLSGDIADEEDSSDTNND
jgi:hypothetical protein